MKEKHRQCGIETEPDKAIVEKHFKLLYSEDTTKERGL